MRLRGWNQSDGFHMVDPELGLRPLQESFTAVATFVESWKWPHLMGFHLQ